MKQELIAHLLKHSVKKGDFTLKSGEKSDWFCDSKQTACRADGILLIADLILEILERAPAEATAIGGLTAGADPIAFGVAAISAERGRPLKSFSIRKESKDHGVEGRLSGALDAGDKVLIIEDTATRGTSAMEAVDCVLALGGIPVMIIAVVDRGATAEAPSPLSTLSAQRKIKYEALVTANDLGFKK